MKPTLQQLYQGELRPNRLPSPTSEEYQDSFTAFNNASERLTQALKAIAPELEPLFKNILDEHTLLCIIEKEDMFQYGFSLGVRLVMEALSLNNT